MIFYRSVFHLIIKSRVNFVIRILILSDVFLYSAENLIVPIFAVFITNELGLGLEVAGLATAVFLIARALFEMPVAYLIDKTRSEKDDLYTSVVGGVLMGLGYFSLIYIEHAWQLYLAKFVIGMGSGISFPGWCSIFTTHIDKKSKAFEWSIYDVLTGVGMAVAAGMGGFLAEYLGFSILFGVVGGLMVLGSLLLLTISKEVLD